MSPVQSFRIFRATGADGSSVDAHAKFVFEPALESDELFDALRCSYPEIKTHAERKRQAVLDFLVQEREADLKALDRLVSGESTSPVRSWSSQSVEQTPATTSFESFSPSNSTQASPVAITPSFKASDSTTASTPSNPAFHVWNASSNKPVKLHKRRCMTDAEKEEYRQRRIIGSCESCKQKRRKCRHYEAAASQAAAKGRSNKRSKSSKTVSTPRSTVSKVASTSGSSGSSPSDAATQSFNTSPAFHTDLTMDRLGFDFDTDMSGQLFPGDFALFNDSPEEDFFNNNTMMPFDNYHNFNFTNNYDSTFTPTTFANNTSNLATTNTTSQAATSDWLGAPTLDSFVDFSSSTSSHLPANTSLSETDIIWGDGAANANRQQSQGTNYIGSGFRSLVQQESAPSLTRTESSQSNASPDDFNPGLIQEPRRTMSAGLHYATPTAVSQSPLSDGIIDERPGSERAESSDSSRDELSSSGRLCSSRQATYVEDLVPPRQSSPDVERRTSSRQASVTDDRRSSALLPVNTPRLPGGDITGIASTIGDIQQRRSGPKQVKPRSVVESRNATGEPSAAIQHNGHPMSTISGLRANPKASKGTLVPNIAAQRRRTARTLAPETVASAPLSSRLPQRADVHLLCKEISPVGSGVYADAAHAEPCRALGLVHTRHGQRAQTAAQATAYAKTALLTASLTAKITAKVKADMHSTPAASTYYTTDIASRTLVFRPKKALFIAPRKLDQRITLTSETADEASALSKLCGDYTLRAILPWYCAYVAQMTRFASNMNVILNAAVSVLGSMEGRRLVAGCTAESAMGTTRPCGMVGVY